MARTIEGEDWQGAELQRVDLRGASIRKSDLDGVRMRGVSLNDADIDGEVFGLRINGVDVWPLLDAELDRLHPERLALKAQDPDALRAGWAGLEAQWDATLARVATMPPGTTDRSVDGEWSFAETLRHLVFATDLWLGQSVLGREGAFSRIGLPFSGWYDHVAELGVDVQARPAYDDVLAVRHERVAMVRDFIATVSAEALAETHPGPPWEEEDPTVLHCLGVIIEEEWLHHRYAVRDLDAIEADGGD